MAAYRGRRQNSQLQINPATELSESVRAAKAGVRSGRLLAPEDARPREPGAGSTVAVMTREAGARSARCAKVRFSTPASRPINPQRMMTSYAILPYKRSIYSLCNMWSVGSSAETCAPKSGRRASPVATSTAASAKPVKADGTKPDHEPSRSASQHGAQRYAMGQGRFQGAAHEDQKQWVQ